MTQSVARAAFAAHLSTMAEHTAACDAVRKPLLEIRDRLDLARSEERAEQAALDSVQKIEADAIIHGGDCEAASAAVIEATARLDRCRRVATTLERQRAELEDSLRSAETTASVAASAGEALLCRLFEEIADEMLGNLSAVGKQVAAAEAAVRTLAAFVGKKGWLPLAERVYTKLHHLKVPSWADQSYPPWEKVLSELAANPNAPIPEVTP